MKGYNKFARVQEMAVLSCSNVKLTTMATCKCVCVRVCVCV